MAARSEEIKGSGSSITATSNATSGTGSASRRWARPRHRRSFQKTRSRSGSRGRKSKYRWHDGHGRQLTAGGILPFDDNGIWVIGEIDKSDVVYTDMGGKYRFEDGDIYQTIAREFVEEMYHSVDASRKTILGLSQTHPATYVNGHSNHPVYLCYVVHTFTLERVGIRMNPKQFLAGRDNIIRSNPCVPEEYYNAVELIHILWKDVSEAMARPPKPVILGDEKFIRLSYRLRRILRYGPLVDKVYPSRPRGMIPPSSTTPPPPEFDRSYTPPIAASSLPRVSPEGSEDSSGGGERSPSPSPTTPE